MRKIVRMAVVASLLLCGAMVAAWAWGHWFPRSWRWTSWRWDGADFVYARASLRLSDGALEIQQERLRFPPPIAARAATILEREPPGFVSAPGASMPLSTWIMISRTGSPKVDFAGLLIVRQPTLGWTAVSIPLWMPAALFAVPPIIVLLRRRWWVIIERSRQGLCPTCGYDLRATTGRCPECGLEPRPAAALVPAWFRLSWAAARARVTACFGWMTLYLVVAVVYQLVLAGLVRDADTFALLAPAAMFPVVFGAFHAARFSRSREAFFCYGCLGGLLLFPPLLLMLERWRMLDGGLAVLLSLGFCLAAILAVGFLTRFAAALQWRRTAVRAATP